MDRCLKLLTVSIKQAIFMDEASTKRIVEAQSRHSEPFGVARAACFEVLACVFASACASLEKPDTIFYARTAVGGIVSFFGIIQVSEK